MSSHVDEINPLIIKALCTFFFREHEIRYYLQKKERKLGKHTKGGLLLDIRDESKVW